MKPFLFDELLEDGPPDAAPQYTFVSAFEDEERARSFCAADSSAPVDREGMERRAFEDAYVQGEKAGYEMGMRKVEPLIKKLQGALAEAASFTQELVQASEKLAVELALLFAESIVVKECVCHRETVAGMVRRALELCEEKNNLVVRVGKGDTSFLDGGSFEVVTDETMGSGDFVIETNFGDIDGHLSTQIEEMRREFLNGNGP